MDLYSCEQVIHGRDARTFIHTTVHDIAALVPAYGRDGGNCTDLYLGQGGTARIVLSVSRVVQLVAEHYCINLQSLRRAFRTEVGKSQYLPLVTGTSGVTYTPVRMRGEAVSKRDGVIGYLCRKNILRYSCNKNGNVVVILVGGQELTLEMSVSLFQNRLEESRRFEILFAHRFTSASNQENSPTYYIVEPDSPSGHTP